MENEGESETRGKTARHAADSAGQRRTASGILAVVDRSVPNNSGVLEPEFAGFRGSAS